MPIILDICVLHKLIPPSASRTASYEKIHRWLISDKAKVAKGGAKYNEELKAARKYLPFFVELDKKRCLVKLKDSDVDTFAQEILNQESDADLDDEHIIAMSIIAKAIGVCTSDVRAERFIKKSEYYPSGITRPKILKESTPVASVSTILARYS